MASTRREERLADTQFRIFVPEIIGLDFVIRELENVEPGLVKQLKQDLVSEIRPLYSKIKNSVQNSRPFIEGFEHSGRTGDLGKAIRVTGKAVKNRRGRKTSLVSIRTTTASGEIADMAGRRSSGTTASGKAMIRKLNKEHGKPSRFIYPAVEKEIPAVQASITKIVGKYADMVNRKIFVTTKDS